MHVGHDLVGHFNQVVGHRFGVDLGKAKVGLGIDQTGVDGHSRDINDLSAGGDFGGIGVAHGGDLAVLHHQHTVIDGSVGDGQQLPAF